MVFDSVVLFCAEAWLYLTHGRQVWIFRKRLRFWPRIARPGTYNERMLWRKAVDHNPLFVVCADKLSAKAYVRQRCPEAAQPRTLWTGVDVDAIPEELLRGDVWVKASHGWNTNIEIAGGAVDRAALKQATEIWIKTVHGRRFHEWSSLRLKPRLFVEEAIKPARGELWEIEVRVASGRFAFGSMVRQNKRPGMWRIYLDRDGRPPPEEQGGEGFGPDGFPGALDLLPAYHEAVRLAERIGGELDYARIDFLWDGERLFAGEITIYPSAGLGPLDYPTVRGAVLREWRLSESDFMRRRHPWPVSWYRNALGRALARAEAAAQAG